MEEKIVEEQSLSLNDLFFLIKKNILLVIIITILATGLASIYGFFIKDITYSSTTTALVGVELKDDESNVTSVIQASQLLINTYKEFIVDPSVINIAHAKLKDKYPNISKYELKSSLSVSVPTSSFIVYITAKTDDPNKSIDFANAIIESSEEVSNTKENEKLKYPVLADKINVLSKAEESSGSRGATTVVILGFVIGVILSFGFIFILYLSDNTFTSKKSFEDAYNINILACIREVESEGI